MKQITDRLMFILLGAMITLIGVIHPETARQALIKSLKNRKLAD